MTKQEWFEKIDAISEQYDTYGCAYLIFQVNVYMSLANVVLWYGMVEVWQLAFFPSLGTLL